MVAVSPVNLWVALVVGFRIYHCICGKLEGYVRKSRLFRKSSLKPISIVIQKAVDPLVQLLSGRGKEIVGDFFQVEFQFAHGEGCPFYKIHDSRIHAELGHGIVDPVVLTDKLGVVDGGGKGWCRCGE